MPLFKITENPSLNPLLHETLKNISGFDSVDLESDSTELTLNDQIREPNEWDSEVNPPYNYYLYYMWANITTLNHFRLSRGMSNQSISSNLI